MGIADFLNGRSIPAMQRKLWSPATIVHMLRREAYGGRTLAALADGGYMGRPAHPLRGGRGMRVGVEAR